MRTLMMRCSKKFKQTTMTDSIKVKGQGTFNSAPTSFYTIAFYVFCSFLLFFYHENVFVSFRFVLLSCHKNCWLPFNMSLSFLFNRKRTQTMKYVQNFYVEIPRCLLKGKEWAFLDFFLPISWNRNIMTDLISHFKS